MKRTSSTGPMTEAERKATQRRLRIWQEAQPELEEQHWRDLMALTDEEALKLTRAIFSRQGVSRETRDSSGLVDQQRIFQRSRQR